MFQKIMQKKDLRIISNISSGQKKKYTEFIPYSKSPGNVFEEWSSQIQYTCSNKTSTEDLPNFKNQIKIDPMATLGTYRIQYSNNKTGYYIR